MAIIKLPKWARWMRDGLNAAVRAGISKLIELLQRLSGPDVFEQTPTNWSEMHSLKQSSDEQGFNVSGSAQ